MQLWVSAKGFQPHEVPPEMLRGWHCWEMRDWSWCTDTLASTSSWWDNSEMGSTLPLSIPQQDWDSIVSVTTCSIIHSLLDFFPFLTPSQLIGISWNHIPNKSLTCKSHSCFRRNPNQNEKKKTSIMNPVTHPRNQQSTTFYLSFSAWGITYNYGSSGKTPLNTR